MVFFIIPHINNSSISIYYKDLFFPIHVFMANKFGTVTTLCGSIQLRFIEFLPGKSLGTITAERPFDLKSAWASLILMALSTHLASSTCWSALLRWISSEIHHGGGNHLCHQRSAGLSNVSSEVWNYRVIPFYQCPDHLWLQHPYFATYSFAFPTAVGNSNNSNTTVWQGFLLSILMH